MRVRGVPNLSNPNRSLKNGLIYSPVTHGVVTSLMSSVQAPGELILQTILGAISTAAQGKVNVERIYGGSGPVSTFTCVVADSGERKTGVSNKVYKPIIDFERREEKKFEEEWTDYEIRQEIFAEQEHLIKLKLKKAIKSNNKEAIFEAKWELKQWQSEKPKRPIKQQLIYENITPESLQIEMKDGFGNVALVSNEGATVLEGPIIRALAFLNSLWSGERFTVSRKTVRSFTLTDTRLTLSLLVQPSAIEKFLKKKGPEALGIGFLGRFIFCNPHTTQGTRFISQSNQGCESGYANYLKRMEEILTELKDMGDSSKPERTVIRFSDEVKGYARELYNEIEAMLGPRGRFEYAKDHGNKLFENITRIAALLSYFEHGKDEKISLGIFQDAERIAFHFSDSYIQAFQVYPDYLKDAYALQEYCQTKRESGERYISKAKIRRSGPSRLRNIETLTRAIELLQSWGELMVYTEPTTRLVYLDLNPNLFHEPHMWSRFYDKYKSHRL